MGQPKYFTRDGASAAEHIPLRDPTSIGASYDRYLQTAQRPSFGSGESGNFSGNQFPTGAYGGMPDVNSPFGATFRDPSMNQLNRSASNPRNWFLEVVAENRSVSRLMDSATRPVVPFQCTQLPSGASNTVFVEGLPPDCTEREVAHIFRPFLGYKETRLVIKDPKSKVICFVDFTNASCAMTAMNALRGYKVDERNPDSPVLKLQFARPHVPKFGHGSCSKA